MDYVSALVIIAPHPVQAFAVPLMRQYCFESLMRVPAHMTVLFPFAPLDQLDGTRQTLRNLCATLPPFDVTLDGYGQFPTTTYLKPRDPEPIKATFRAVHAAFPDYLPYNGQFGNDDILPHMTVGEFHSEAERDQANYPVFEPITFRVQRLHLIAGMPYEPIPWVTQDVFWFGSGG
ncbi:MAG TPA: 2'-5' RNA ligase family protein [Phototrophicaceae bacterium]|nr:2'-5' RNA ligase family protein [Phototrophicaceae bacterium]